MKFIDQLGHAITLAHPPKRIVSLVPSQTELLFDLDLDDEIVGITRFCVHPPEKCSKKTNVGGTKQFNFETIDQLEPDLILGNKEENYQDGIEHLRQRYPVWLSDIVTLSDAYAMIEAVGALVDREKIARQLTERIRENMSGLSNWPRLRAAYFIWRKPYMTVGHRTFAHEMLCHAGFTNVFGHLARYPEVTPTQILAAKPEILLLPSEPFPFAEKHIHEFRDLFPEIPAILVDGQMFTWYGSRLLRVPAYFHALRYRLQTFKMRERRSYLPRSTEED